MAGNCTKIIIKDNYKLIEIEITQTTKLSSVIFLHLHCIFCAVSSIFAFALTLELSYLWRQKDAPWIFWVAFVLQQLSSRLVPVCGEFMRGYNYQHRIQKIETQLLNAIILKLWCEIIMPGKDDGVTLR